MIFPNLNSWWIVQYSLSPHNLVFPWNFPCDLPKFSRRSDAAVQPRSPSSVERLEQLPGVGTGSAGGGSCSSADQALRRWLRASRASRALGLGATPWRWVKMRWDIRVLRDFHGFFVGNLEKRHETSKLDGFEILDFCEALSALLMKDDVEFGPTMMVIYFLLKKLEICWPAKALSIRLRDWWGRLAQKHRGSWQAWKSPEAWNRKIIELWLGMFQQIVFDYRISFVCLILPGFLCAPETAVSISWSFWVSEHIKGIATKGW